MKIRFSYLLFVLALIISGCAAYFSVWGLSQLFAGASLGVIIMAGGLEIAKIGVTTAVHRHGKRYGGMLRTYAIAAVIILMMITSAGIYGYLSNAYQTTANKLEVQKGQVGILDNKKALFQKDADDNQSVITTKNKRIEQLTNLRTTQESRLDSARTSYGKDKVRTDIQKATDEIQKLTGDIDALNAKNASLSDSISSYTVKSLELNSNSQVAAEVGPLKYISELTGYPMGKVVNVLILLFIVVFDPLAIALILMANKTLDIENEDKLLPVVKPEPKTPVIEEKPVSVDTFAAPATPEAFIQIPNEEHHEEVYEDEGVNEEEHEGVTEHEVIDEPVIDTVSDTVDEPVTEDLPVVSEGVNDGVTPQPAPILAPETPNTDTVFIREPVIPTGKIELKDIKEIKDRGKKSHTVERIGTNKVIKDGDNNKLFFKRK